VLLGIKMINIQYKTGDATKPVKVPAIIAHICNDISAWGSGFVVPLGKRYPQAKLAYLGLCDPEPATTQIVTCSDTITVANMIAQRDIVMHKDEPPIRYEWLESCLGQVADYALEVKASVHMPRIGTGLAKGSWDRVEPLIIKQLSSKDIEVFVYDLVKKRILQNVRLPVNYQDPIPM
jgi:O-acetyl-ADP-ribose deacetylase (regulator of RNase III)